MKKGRQQTAVARRSRARARDRSLSKCRACREAFRHSAGSGLLPRVPAAHAVSAQGLTHGADARTKLRIRDDDDDDDNDDDRAGEALLEAVPDAAAGAAGVVGAVDAARRRRRRSLALSPSSRRR